MTRRKGPRHMEKIGKVWYYRRAVPVALRDKVGATRFKQSLGPNLREAERLRDIRDAQVDASIKRPDAYVSFKDFAENRWLKEQVALRRNAKGLNLSRVRMELHVFPLLGKLPLDAVRRQHLRALVLELTGKHRKRPLSIQTAKHILADVLCCLRFAHLDCELIERVPSTRDLLPKMDEAVPDPIPEDDMAKLMAVANADEAFVLDLASWTGMRMGEIDRAHRRNVVLGKAPEIFIPKSKSHKARSVPLMDFMAGRIQLWMESHDSVMVSPLRYDELSRLMRKLCRRAKVKAHFHQLRDTFGCRWLAAGGGILELQAIYGHSDLRLTQRYARLMAGHVSREAGRIGRLFGKVALAVAPEGDSKAERLGEGGR